MARFKQTKEKDPFEVSKFKQTEIGIIPEDWEVKNVEDFCMKITSGGTPLRNNKEYWENGTIPWLKTQELNDATIYAAEEKITQLGANNSSAKLFPKNTILMAMYGATVGKLGLLKIEATTNQAFCAMIVNKDVADYKYLFYALLRYRDNLINLASGAAQQNLNQDIIKNFKIPYPSLDEQKSIAKILSDLDSKIEFNQQMNKTLESIGQALFKHWFVDFEFPNEKGKPYKSSGGEMIDSELGKIPKGWKVGQVKDLGKIVCGKTPPTKDKENYGNDVPFITIPDMHGQIFIFETERKLSQDGANTQQNKYLPPLSTCVSCIATPGMVVMTTVSSQTNQQINSIIPKKDISPYFVYFTMKNKTEEIKQKGLGGTTTLNLNTGNFEKINILLPDIDIINLFHKIVDNMLNKILINNKSNLELIKIRDSLLPKLMSGQVRVKT